MHCNICSEKNPCPDCLLDTVKGTYLPSISILLNEYEKEGKPHLRLGQYFVGYYVKYSWPELFYEENQEKAIKAISVYLEHLQYINELPQKVR